MADIDTTARDVGDTTVEPVTNMHLRLRYDRAVTDEDCRAVEAALRATLVEGRVFVLPACASVEWVKLEGSGVA